MKRLALLFTLTLTGCTTLDPVVQRGGDLVDGLNGKALWQLCEGSTLGGYQRLPPEIKTEVNALCVARGQPWQAPG